MDLAGQDGDRPTRHARSLNMPRLEPFWAEAPSFPDAFLNELVAAEPVQRLRRVGFLGAVDYLVHGNGHAPHRRRHNRFDHSVNVALLALRYALLRELSSEETRILTSAALLHDVGHGPLSHTLEPVFRSLFGTDHHRAGQAILEGRSPHGNAISQIFAKHGVDLDEVLGLLSGVHTGPHAFLFDSPMNVDTIEAIARCCLFSNTPHHVPPADFIDAIAIHENFPTEIADRFWSCKEVVYRSLIGSRSGLAADMLAQCYMVARAAHFDGSDFHLDDIQLRRKHPELFVLLETLRNPAGFCEEGALAFQLVDLDCEVEAYTRRFTVNTGARVHSPKDLTVRYAQEKTRYRISLRSLLGRYQHPSERPFLHDLESPLMD
ncbi:MAG TPA: HD domain-containing protein [Steroidobacteraceae bacterium]|nr:HD domain-containing protein [Steroidobacteraceae bacterium]